MGKYSTIYPNQNLIFTVFRQIKMNSLIQPSVCMKGLKLKVKTAGKALKNCIPEEGLSSECCGLKLTLEKSPNPQPRSSFRHRLFKITDVHNNPEAEAQTSYAHSA